MQCFVCLKATATRRITITKTDGTSGGSYVCCDGCEPRHIPQGQIMALESKPLNGGK